jgi:hypothetical protein
MLALSAVGELAAASEPPAAAQTADTLTLRAIVNELCAPSCAGRRSGSPGGAVARRTLEARLAALGLSPLEGQESLAQAFAIQGLALDSLRGRLLDPEGKPTPLQLSVNAPCAPLGPVRLAAWPADRPLPLTAQGALVVRQGPAGPAGAEAFSPTVLLDEAVAGAALGLLLVPHPADSSGIFARHLARSRGRDPRVYALAAAEPGPLLAFADGPAAAGVFAGATAQPIGWRLELPGGQPLAHRGFNLVGRLAPTGESAAAAPPAAGEPPVILLCAHYDHIGEGPEGVFPGADDNASGVATLLELLRLVADQPRAAELRFLFPDAEELGMLGARAYLARWGKPALVINLDSVGRAGVASYRELRDPAAADPRRLIHWSAAPPGDRATAALDAALDAQGFRVEPGAGAMFARGGDHWVFAEAGVPAHFLFGGFHADYNTVNDRPERILVDRLALLAQALAAVAAAAGPLAP